MNRIVLAFAALVACLGIVPGAPAQSTPQARRVIPADAIVPVPIMETARGETPIELRGLQIHARLRGGLAETTVRMAFHNPNARQLEGTLNFPLLDGQQVTGFALDFERRLRPAVPVGKARGREVFEAIERRGVDPALLEKTEGNNFRLRVYPIPPKGVRIVEVRYAEALARQAGTRRYRLPLAYGAAVRDFRLQVDSDAPTSPQASGAVGALPFTARGGLFHAELGRSDGGPAGVVEIRVPVPDRAQASIETRADGRWFLAEVPVASRTPTRRLPARIGLLWDASLSGAKRPHAVEFAVLDAYFRKLRDGSVRLVRLRDRPEAALDFRIRRGDWSALRRVLEATQYDGASALADWRPEPGVGEYLLVSDGLLNYGPRGFAALAPGQRLYALNSARSADRDRLRAVAEGSGGRFVELTGRAAEDASALLVEHPRVVALSGTGLADLEAAPGGAQDGFVRVAGKLLAPSATLSVRLADGSEARLPIDATGPSSPFAAREWAAYRLAALAAQPELRRAEIAELGTRFGIATSETSLIVLDTVEDYVQYDITPPPELAKAYAALRATRDAARAGKRQDQLERVVDAYAKKIAWWEQAFPKGARPPPPKPSKAQGVSLDSVAVVGNSVVSAADAAEFSADAAATPPSVARRVNAVDVASVESTTILTAEQAARVPVPRDVTAVALLAPGTVRADTTEEARQAAAEPAQIAIAVTPWQADAPYIATLRAAADDALYAQYLATRATHADSVGFYVDVAELLLERKQRDLALRVLSNLAELDLDNRQVLRVLGYRLLQMGEPALAVPVFEAVLRHADYEPQSWRDLGNALAAAGRGQAAVDALAEVVARPWDNRFAEIDLIALTELNAIAATASPALDLGRVDPRLRRNLPMDLRAVLAWDADDSDLDLWVTDPNGEKAFYGHKLTYQGGRMSDDFTGGYGPEEFALRDAKPGRYAVEVHYYGDGQQIVAGPTSLQLRFTTQFGTPAARDQLVSLRLKEGSQSVLVGEFDVE